MIKWSETKWNKRRLLEVNFSLYCLSWWLFLTVKFWISEISEALRPGECLVSLTGVWSLRTGAEETVQITRLLSVPGWGGRGTVLDNVWDDSLRVLIETENIQDNCKTWWDFKALSVSTVIVRWKLYWIVCSWWIWSWPQSSGLACCPWEEGWES